ncbi:MAG: hypothetical protein IK134_04130 [Oscillospiraceae bacterium]|nr:hypothetical protein [Oscillospiraceae bacterium]
MRNDSRNLSSRVALGGIVAALCIVIMFLTGVLPALYIAAPMAAGLLMIILVEEVSVGWAWLTYLAVSLLALIVTFDKEAALMFILFFGYYPMLRLYLEKIKSRPLKTVCKYAVFNLFLLLDYLATVYVLGLPTFEDTGPVMFVILFLAFNLVFYFYDKVLSRMDWFYHQIFVKKVLGKRRI